MLGYCRAIVDAKTYGVELAGGHQCTRLAKRSIGGVVLCEQHYKAAESHEVPYRVPGEWGWVKA